jgi:flavodoxin
VDNKKQKVIVVFSPQEGDLKTLAETIAHKYEETNCSVVLKSAEQVSIPEINAADILVFGTEEEGTALLSGGYREIARAFSGINLAGKIGAFFSYSRGESIQNLREMVKDTDLELISSDLIFLQNGKSIKDKKIDKWINQTRTTKA